MIGRRSLLGGLLLAPAIIRTPDLLMAISGDPYLLLRIYGHIGLPSPHLSPPETLLKTVRMDDPSGSISLIDRAPLAGLTIHRITAEPRRYRLPCDGREHPLHIERLNQPVVPLVNLVMPRLDLRYSDGRGGLRRLT